MAAIYKDYNPSCFLQIEIKESTRKEGGFQMNNKFELKKIQKTTFNNADSVMFTKKCNLRVTI